MLVIVQTEDDRLSPVFVCDVCQQRISDATKAAVVSALDPPDGAHWIKPVHAHFGVCQNKAEAAVKKQTGHMAGWDNLDRHIRQLVHNTGLSLKMLAAVEPELF